MNRTGAENNCRTLFGIRTVHLSKSYGDETVIRDLSAEFLCGGRYCLMSPSGTGKTTFFRLLMGLEKPDSGQISFPVREENSSGVTRYPSRPRFSAVFQEDRLLEGYTLLENIRFVTGRRMPADLIRETALRLLPEDSLKKPVSEYSGGMRRRAAILRSLLAPSDILLMDEPFSGLDPDSRQAAASVICELLRDRLLLVSTHNEEDHLLLGAGIFRLRP